MTKTINPALETELEQLAEGVEQDRQREYLERVRPALYAIQNGLAIAEAPIEVTGTGLAAKVKGLIQTQEAFADDLLAVEQCAENAVKQRQQKEAAKDPLREAIYAVKRETTSKILQISKTLAEIVDNNFAIDFQHSLKNGAYWGTLRREGKAIEISVHNEYIDKYRTEMKVTINPKNEKIKLKHEQAYYGIAGKREVTERLSLFSKKPEDAFRIVADKYVVETQNEYLQTFLEMYAALPQIILEAAKQFMADESQKRQTLEDSARGIKQLAEGTR